MRLDCVNNLVERIERPSLQKREWLELQSNMRPPIGKSNLAEFPLKRDALVHPTVSQQRILLVEKQNPNDYRHNLTQIFRLTGPFDSTALEMALEHLVLRHDAFRMGFSDGDPSTVLVLSAGVRILEKEDLSGLVQSEQEKIISVLLDQNAMRPFDVVNGPLIRVLLIKIGEYETLLARTVHHIIYDGWSSGLFYRELADLYKNFSCGKDPCLPEFTFGFRDFIQWENDCLRQGKFLTQLSYWLKRLSKPPRLNFPVEYREGLGQPFLPGYMSFNLDYIISGHFRNLLKQYQVTEFIGFLAVFALLIEKYSSQGEVIIGCPMARRNWSEFENFIGYVADTQLFRIGLFNCPTFLKLAHHVRDVAVEAYENQNVPLPAIMYLLQGTAQYVPIYDVRFVYEGFPQPSLKLPGIEIQPFKVAQRGYGGSTRHLSLYITDVGTHFKGTLLYNSRLFSGSFAEEFLKNVKQIIYLIVQDPEASMFGF